jgi:hypothetical protein
MSRFFRHGLPGAALSFARFGALVAACVAALATAPRNAWAEDPPKRAVPDYEGRPPPAPSAGDVALWIPRVLFSPVYFTSEFLIRRPIGALIAGAERANLPTVLYDFFAFGPEHKAGFVPLAFFDFGFQPSVGLYLFWDDAFFNGDDLRLHASTWGADWLAGSLTQRIRLPGARSLTLAGVAIRRPDHVYYGMGPSTLQSAQSRYGEDSLDGTMTFDVPLWRSSRVQTAIGVQTASFYDGHFAGNPTLTQQVRAGVFALPPGFASGYTAETNRILVALDSRRKYPAPGSGVRLEGRVLLGNDLAQSPASGWIRTDASAAGYLDIDGHRRVVSLAAQTSFSDPLGPRPVPFTELVSLGGDVEPMPGFYPGRLVDRSAAVATLRYRWPIAPWLNGSMQAAVGNVFGPHLEGFDPGLLRLSAALGIESDSSPDNAIHFLIGFGTETFDHGAQVDSFRLAFGTSRF